MGQRFFNLLIVFLLIGVSAQRGTAYILSNLPPGESTGAVTRWHQASLPGGAIAYLVNPLQPSGAIPINPPGTTPAQLIDVVRAAFQAWEDVPTSTIRYSFLGTTADTDGLDFRNIVTFSPQGTFSPGVLAVTITTRALRAGPIEIPDLPIVTADFAGQILDADIVINPQETFTVSDAGPPPSGTFDLPGVLTHEIGHLSGLEHTGIYAATMWALPVNGGFLARTLAQDDEIGISTLYPESGFLSNTGRVAGTVRRPDGRPVFGTHVMAIHADTGVVTTSAITGLVATAPNGMPLQFGRASGDYLLTGLLPGSYTILAAPLDCSTPFTLRGIFAPGVGGALFIETDFLPAFSAAPISIAPGQLISGVDLTVGNRAASASLLCADLKFTLTVSKGGSGSGTVSTGLGEIDCGGDCGELYPSDITVTLAAMPDPGSIFAGWSGAGCSGTGFCTVTMTGDTQIAATFEVQQFSLTVTKAGTGDGTVTSSPAGITCGGDCSEAYPNGTSVTLTATPASGSTFAGWSGGGCNGAEPCTVTMTADTTVTATFNMQQFSLTVTKAGRGSGTVTSSPAGIACGGDCSELYLDGTIVTLAATPDRGSIFAGWSGGGCSGKGTCTVTMNANTTVSAIFKKSRRK